MAKFNVEVNKKESKGLVGAEVTVYEGSDAVDSIKIVDEEDFGELSDKIDDLDDSVVANTTKITNVETTVNNHDSRITNNTTTIGQVNTHVGLVNTQLDSLEDTVGGIEYDLTSLSNTVSNKADSVHNHDTKYYTKSEVDALIEQLANEFSGKIGFEAKIVSALPQTGSNGIIYLLPSEHPTEGNLYDEYIWSDGRYEPFATNDVNVDLTGYATTNYVTNALQDYVQSSTYTTGLNGKSDVGHNHDDRYYTESEMDTKLGGKANSSHSHSITNITNLQSALDGKADTTVATTSNNGLMSSNDKSKLDGLAAGANNYVLPTASATTLGGIKIGANLTINDGVVSGTPDTTYAPATTSENGLMSNTDKIKLDGIEAGANKTIVDSALSSESENPVQNNVVNTALSSKAPITHTHTHTAQIYTPQFDSSFVTNGGCSFTRKGDVCTFSFVLSGGGGAFTDSGVWFIITTEKIPTSYRLAGSTVYYMFPARNTSQTSGAVKIDPDGNVRMWVDYMKRPFQIYGNITYVCQGD